MLIPVNTRYEYMCHTYSMYEQSYTSAYGSTCVQSTEGMPTASGVLLYEVQPSTYSYNRIEVLAVWCVGLPVVSREMTMFWSRFDRFDP